MFAAINSFQTAGGVAAPVNTVAPAVTGNAYSTYSLTTTTGTWTGTGITYTYQWQHTTTNISGATSSSYTVSSAYVGETIRCVVTATNSAGNSSANSNNTAAVGATGQIIITTPQISSWIVPAGVTSISFVAIAGAGGGGGGGLAYASNQSVTPGQSIGIYNTYGGANSSEVRNGTTQWVLANGSSSSTGGNGGTANGKGTGGNGGNGTYSGGGAGGYSGNGGAGATGYNTNGSVGAGGGGGGGGRGPSSIREAGGGGVDLRGLGASGTAGTYAGNISNGGGWGSCGTTGGNSYITLVHTCCTYSYYACVVGVGGQYGGGNGGGSNAGIRIMYPGQLRQFPSTCTQDR